MRRGERRRNRQPAGMMALGGIAAAAGCLCLLAGPAEGVELTGDAGRASKVRGLTLELSQAEALRELDGASSADQLLEIERARALLYEGRCAEAAAILSRPDLSEADEPAAMGGVARGCERTMAGAVVVEHAASGAWIRFQDDADVALAPLLFEVVERTRARFKQDLGVDMPRPVRLELVRDQFGLAAMTGLPLAAARTTGTVGVAKWGRVIVVSPRATAKGYPILDTISHELTHLALTRGSRDRAPLWLQEGVARELEGAWREPHFFDDVPSADDIAAFGIRKKLGPDIDKIGPSIALLPTAEEAHVTYAKVQSFMRYFGKEAGADATARLLAELKEAELDAAIEKVSGAPFSAWSDRWKGYVERSARELSEEQKPGAPAHKDVKEVRKRFRLGELMLDRGHARAAARELDKGHTLMKRDALVRALYAKALLGEGARDKATKLVEDPKDVSGNEARWWSLRAVLEVGDRGAAVRLATSLAPYDPNVACMEKAPPDAPEDDVQKALCQAARDRPRAR